MSSDALSCKLCKRKARFPLAGLFCERAGQKARGGPWRLCKGSSHNRYRTGDRSSIHDRTIDFERWIKPAGSRRYSVGIRRLELRHCSSEMPTGSPTSDGALPPSQRSPAKSCASVRVRQLTRTLALEAGLSLVDQTKVITAASELARNTLDYGGADLCLQS